MFDQKNTNPNKQTVFYHRVEKFPNGYGASIVCHENSYGGRSMLFEIAVLDQNGDICYDTPVAGDVIGYLDFDGVSKVLDQIKKL